MENNYPPAIVRVIRPKLTPEEREKRMEQIKQAAIRVLIAAQNRST